MRIGYSCVNYLKTVSFIFKLIFKLIFIHMLFFSHISVFAAENQDLVSNGICVSCLSDASVSKNCVKRAIVIGATSGMGRQVAKLLATEGGYEVGLVGRRVNLLESLQKEIQEKTCELGKKACGFGEKTCVRETKTCIKQTDVPNCEEAKTYIKQTDVPNCEKAKTYIKQIDVCKPEEAKKLLCELIDQMGGLDLMFISVSSLFDVAGNANKPERDARLVKVDILGFMSMAEIAIEFFEKQKSGHLVGISSLSGVRGDASWPAYSGAKAFVAKYLEGVRNYMIQHKIPIYVTDIVPGWVDNERMMFSQVPGTYWVTPLEKAGRQIFEAIQAKKKVAYISKRQILIKLALVICPDFIYNAIGGF